MFNKQKIAAVSSSIAMLSLLLTTCSISPAGATEKLNNEKTLANNISIMELLTGNQNREKTMLEMYQEELLEIKAKEEKLQAKLDANTEKMDNAIRKLKKYVGVTWYSYSGSTPSGWDCSGLVRWTYEQVGIDLYHRAGVQKNAGTFVKASDAKPGDIVAFGWKGYSGAGHVGIYIGNGKMIHSPRSGLRTTIEDVSDFGSYGYSKVTYTRILETN